MPNRTNPPGKGTVNLSINFHSAERTILVKLAIEKNQSIGALVRSLAEAGLRSVCPDTAETFQAIRRNARAERLTMEKTKGTMSAEQIKPPKKIEQSFNELQATAIRSHPTTPCGQAVADAMKSLNAQPLAFQKPDAGQSVEPPKDGTLIWATGNVVWEMFSDNADDPAADSVIGNSADSFEGAMYFDTDAQEWLWAGKRMSVRQCSTDAICFHWWTQLEAA